MLRRLAETERVIDSVHEARAERVLRVLREHTDITPLLEQQVREALALREGELLAEMEQVIAEASLHGQTAGAATLRLIRGEDLAPFDSRPRPMLTLCASRASESGDGSPETG